MRSGRRGCCEGIPLSTLSGSVTALGAPMAMAPPLAGALALADLARSAREADTCRGSRCARLRLPRAAPPRMCQDVDRRPSSAAYVTPGSRKRGWHDWHGGEAGFAESRGWRRLVARRSVWGVVGVATSAMGRLRWPAGACASAPRCRMRYSRRQGGVLEDADTNTTRAYDLRKLKVCRGGHLSLDAFLRGV